MPLCSTNTYMQRCFQSKCYYIHFSQIAARVCTSVFFIFNVFRSVLVLFNNLCNNFFTQYKHTYGRLRASHRSHMKGCTCFIQEAHTNERLISCDGHQLYAFKGWGVDLEVEGVHYIDMHRRPHMCKGRLLQGVEISN